jgi:hypothetical protein
VTPARAARLRWTLTGTACVLACIGFFAHGLHEWVRVSMFVGIVGVAAWGNGAQTRVGVREPKPAPRPVVVDVPVERTLAE